MKTKLLNPLLWIFISLFIFTGCSPASDRQVQEEIQSEEIQREVQVMGAETLVIGEPIEPGLCEENPGICDQVGLDAEVCCTAAGGACTGSVVPLTGNVKASSTRSAANCHFVADSVFLNHCQTNGLPNNCSGSCPPGQTCKGTGEATNSTITRQGPPVWECEATQGRCYCGCL